MKIVLDRDEIEDLLLEHFINSKISDKKIHSIWVGLNADGDIECDVNFKTLIAEATPLEQAKENS